MIFIGNSLYSNTLNVDKSILDNENNLVTKEDLSSDINLNFYEIVENEIHKDLKNKMKDCTVKIKGNFDGVEVDIEVTVYDVSWTKCTLFQLGIKALY